VDEHGFDELDRRILTTIIEKFGGGPVGIGCDRRLAGRDRGTLEDLYEPYLLQAGFLQRTPRGRSPRRRPIAILGIVVAARETDRCSKDRLNGSSTGNVPTARRTMKRGLLIYNPTAGQRDRRAQMGAVAESARARGLELINAPTDAPGHATEIVRSFLPQGLDVVVVCGGDGTISEVACGLAGSGVPLAILPGGTSNVPRPRAGDPPRPRPGDGAALRGRTAPGAAFLANERPFLLWTGIGLRRPHHGPA
jgi:hypothetical protein